MKKFFIAVATLVALVSCQKESYYAQKGKSLDVTALIEQNVTETKTTVNGLIVNWSAGDQIALYDASGNNAVYQVLTGGSSSATFSEVSSTGTLTGDVVAFFPASYVTGYTVSDGFTVAIPSSLAYSTTGFGEGSAPMIGKGTVSGEKLALSFKNMFGLLELQLKKASSASDTKTLSSISITSDQTLCGSATVNFSGETPAVTWTSEKKAITLSGIGTELITEAKSYYIPVPAGSHTFVVKTVCEETLLGNTMMYKEAKKANTVTRNHILQMPAFDVAQGACNCTYDGIAASMVSDIIWAPVDCGYSATNQTGLYYQHGRKDGIPRGLTLEELTGDPVSSKWYYTTTALSDYSDIKANVFYAVRAAWYVGTTPALNDLWDEKKTEYDPCPDGWRVPSDTDFNQLYSSDQSKTVLRTSQILNGVKYRAKRYYGVVECDSSGNWPDGANSVLLPCTGAYNVDSHLFSSTNASAAASEGYYHTSVNGRRFDIGRMTSTDTNVSKIASTSAGFGFNVRCIKE